MALRERSDLEARGDLLRIVLIAVRDAVVGHAVEHPDAVAEHARPEVAVQLDAEVAIRSARRRIGALAEDDGRVVLEPLEREGRLGLADPKPERVVRAYVEPGVVEDRPPLGEVGHHAEGHDARDLPLDVQASATEEELIGQLVLVVDEHAKVGLHDRADPQLVGPVVARDGGAAVTDRDARRTGLRRRRPLPREGDERGRE